MKTKNVNWINVIEGVEIKTGKNSQIRTALAEMVEGSVVGVVTFQKWAKYCTASDKMMGLTKDDASFRPTKQSIAFPFAVIPQIVTELQKIYDYAVSNGIAEYDPNSLLIHTRNGDYLQGGDVNVS